MPTGFSITVNDRETTPVAHTFAPSGRVEDGVRFIENSSSGVTIGQRSLILRAKQPSPSSRRTVRVTLASPTLVTETINGVAVPSVPRTAYVDCTFKFDAGSTSQERKNLVGMFANALAASQTNIDAVLTGLDSVW